jgi:ATP-dependent DNA helicase RecG
MLNLKDPCTKVPGVGQVIYEKLKNIGIVSILDLILHLPRQYQDKTHVTAIRDLRQGALAVVVAKVYHVEVKNGKRKSLVVSVNDDSGSMNLRFFHFSNYQVKSLERLPKIKFFGEIAKYSLEMLHPEYQIIADDTPQVPEHLTPIYGATQGLSQNKLRAIMQSALETYKAQIDSLEWLDAESLKALNLEHISQAIYNLHNQLPCANLQSLENGEDPSLRRLSLEELVANKLNLAYARQKREAFTAPQMVIQKDFIETFLHSLPFSLTQSQVKVYQEILTDLQNNKPMLRLVQGDVGCGKTIIAAIAAIAVINNDYQVALMAPTDLVSLQHAKLLEKYFSPLGIKVKRLSGQMSAKDRTETMLALESQNKLLLVGTHALFQKNVHFKNLGLVIIDEQHRFGVEQRRALQNKGSIENSLPHQLLMTATPIPRTLAMSQYADIDISCIDELPKGRLPIVTTLHNISKIAEIIPRIANIISGGRQAYFICPLIDESEKINCMSAIKRFEYLQECLPEFKVGLIHGQMQTAVKESVMAEFQQNNIHILVATTVVEVGVDVPNASLIIIENAERLGLSQLHQLRGRVGRGNYQSHCLILYQEPLSQQSAERLKALRGSNDGFVLAEKDLELRGAGEFLGTRQTGYSSYRIAMLPRDKELLHTANIIGKNLIKTHSPVAVEIARRWHDDAHELHLCT